MDAHSLIWFITEDDRLSKRVKYMLEQAEDAEAQVLIPTIVLAEITYIAQKKKVEITVDSILEVIEQSSGFIVVPFDFLIFQAMLQLPNTWEIHDRIIVATSRYYKAVLITRDLILQDSDQIETIW